MQRFGSGMLVLALTILIASPALAQRTKGQQQRPSGPQGAQGQPGGPFPQGRGGGPAMTITIPDLLQIEAVQEELQLNDRQRERVREIGEQMRNAMASMFPVGPAGPGGPGGPGGRGAGPGAQGRGPGGPGAGPGAQGRGPGGQGQRPGGPGGFPGGPGGPGAQGRGQGGFPGGPGGPGFDTSRFQEMMAAREKLTQQATSALGKVLDADQRARVGQIQIQARGTSVFQDPKVVEGLKLTDEQQDQINELIDASREELRTAMQAAREENEEGPPDFQAMGQMRQEIERATKEQILDLLTDEQRAIWDEQTGEPFELPAGPGFGFGFGGFGGFGGPGPGGPGGRGPGGGGRGPGGGGRGPGGAGFGQGRPGGPDR